MEKDALLVLRQPLEQIYAQAQKGHMANTAKLIKALLDLCPPVNRQLAQSAPCLMKALDELLGVINIDDSGYCYICQEAVGEVEIALAARLWAQGSAEYAPTIRGGIGHRLKDALAAVAIQHEELEWFYGFAKSVKELLVCCADVLEDRGSSWKCMALGAQANHVKIQVEAKLPAASKEGN